MECHVVHQVILQQITLKGELIFWLWILIRADYVLDMPTHTITLI
jgi:hypothetical protein